MKLSILAFIAAWPMSLLIAEELPAGASGGVVAEAGRPSTEDLRKQLVETAMQEQEALRKSSEDGPYHNTIPNFLHVVESMTAEEFDPARSRNLLSSRILPDVEAFRKTRELATAYFKRLEEDADEARRKFETENIASIKSMLGQVLSTDDPGKLDELQNKLESLFSNASHSRSGFYRTSGSRSSFLGDSSKVNRFVSQVEQLHSYRAAEAWGNAASTLREMKSSVQQLGRYLSAEETDAYIAKMQERIGILPPEKMKELFGRMLGELLDDANQERLADIRRTIRIQRELNQYSPGKGDSAKWQQLDSLATNLAKSVERVKVGGGAQFSPDQWSGSNADGPQIITADELTKRLKHYEVRVPGKDGEVSLEPVLYNIDEILARIQSPADIGRELPAFGKAMRQAESMSGGGSWSQLAAKLNQYAELYSKLAAGAAFQLPMVAQGDYDGYGYSRMPGGNDAASRKAEDLNRQLQWMILQRFCPAAEGDANSPAPAALNRIFEQARAKGDYSLMFVLNRLSAYFTPGQMPLTPQGGSAIQHYLNGVRQEEQLDQPRLATYHYQRAAAVADCPIPVSELKHRLQGIKQRAPEAYEQGTDDSLKAGIEAAGSPYQTVLMVPAKAEAGVGGKAPPD